MFMFMSEQSVRIYQSSALHNSFAVSRGRTTFQEVLRALLELGPEAQETWRHAAELDAGTCVRQNM